MTTNELLSSTAIPRSGSPWTAESIELLKQLWDRKWSCSQIAAELSLTRNAIIGKAHRLGLSRPKVPIKTAALDKLEQLAVTQPKKLTDKFHRNPSGWRGKPKKRTAKPLPSLPGPCAFPDLTHAVSIFEHREGQCRWIVVEAAPNIYDLRYCGAEVEWSGCSYCGFHNRIAA
jgi:GcrA cell cycle regulator